MRGFLPEIVSLQENYTTVIVKSAISKYMKVSVIAHPNAKHPRVEKDLLDTIHVFVKEPPLEGKANAAIPRALAEYFKVKKTDVQLISGAKSKNKIIEIS